MNCSDRGQILVHGPMVQHLCMPNINGSGIFIVQRVRVPSGGIEFGKVFVIMFLGSICSKQLFY